MKYHAKSINLYCVFCRGVMKKKLELLVLECPWSDELEDRQSVRLFMQGWADLNKISLSYRMYYSTRDLTLWLARFIKHDEMQVCYIAGHGKGGRLRGHINGINLNKVARSTSSRGPGGHYNKGILLGACDVGKNLEEFMLNCGSRISWVAGYDRETPWLEGTISDLLFLEYKLKGRIKTDATGEFIKDNDDQFIFAHARKAARIARWVLEDYPLAAKCGFRAIDR